MEDITMDQENINRVVFILLNGFKSNYKFSHARAMLVDEWVGDGK